MSHTIPESIVAALAELGEALGAWCAEGRERALEAHERAVLERVRTTLPRLLRAVERPREAAEPVEAAPGALLVEADGALVRYRDGWQVKLGLVGGWDGGAVAAPSYVAAREPAAAFGHRLAAEAARRGALEMVGWEHAPGGAPGDRLPAVAVLREAVVLGDGAPWIWGLAEEHFGARVEVVDYFHAAEHLHALAGALFGEGEPAAAWARARTADLLARGPAPVLAALRAAAPPTTEAAERARLERGYFAGNAERMAYPELRPDGLPIGSGAVESAADHLIQRRMKRAGMRWSEAGGDAILALRARLRSGRPLAPALAA